MHFHGNGFKKLDISEHFRKFPFPDIPIRLHFLSSHGNSQKFPFPNISDKISGTAIVGGTPQRRGRLPRRRQHLAQVASHLSAKPQHPRRRSSAWVTAAALELSHRKEKARQAVPERSALLRGGGVHVRSVQECAGAVARRKAFVLAALALNSCSHARGAVCARMPHAGC